MAATQRRRDEPEIEAQPWLELRGQFEEPVKGVSRLHISNYPREPLTVGSARPASVGAIVGMKPEMVVVLTWSNADFDRLWAMALAGRIGFVHLVFTKPQYNSGLVTSASFSSEREE